MSDFDRTHPGAFSKRQHTPPEIELQSHIARDLENLHLELVQLKASCDVIVSRGEESFMNDPAEIDYLAGCMVVVRLTDVIADRIPEVAKAAHPHVPWHQIIGMRNLLAHDYRNANKTTVWQTLEGDFSDLLDDLIADADLQ